MVRRRRCRHDSNPFFLCYRWNRSRGPQGPQNWLPAPAAPRGGRTSLVPAKTSENSSPESFYWHPCRASASPLTAGKRAMHEFPRQRCFIETFPPHNQPDAAHADSAFPARHPPEHRHDSQALRLLGSDRPHHRTGRVPRLRPAFPPGGNMSASSGTSPGRSSRRGARHRAAACCCSPPGPPPTTAISVTRRRTSCYSGARAPASPTRWSRPRMRGW